MKDLVKNINHRLDILLILEPRAGFVKIELFFPEGKTQCVVLVRERNPKMLTTVC